MPARVALQGSERGHIADAQPAGELDQSASIEVTLVLRRRAELPYGAGANGPSTAALSSDELSARYGADPADISLVIRSMADQGLTVLETDAASRRIKVSGTISDMSETFGTSLRLVSSPRPHGTGQVTHRYRTGGLSIPAELNGIVTAVLGLDDRPAARPHLRPRTQPSGTKAYSPPQIADAYQFPPGTDGAGQNIAVIELGGGFRTGDLARYFDGLGITEPSVTAVGVDGAANSPGGAADGEVMLDIEVVGAVAPGASQRVYFAPNTDQGFVDAIAQAAHASPTPTAMSISWGQSEDSWTAQARSAMDHAIADAVTLGVTVTVASGDNGSKDGVSDDAQHVDFPASSPHALACGGTRLEASGTTISSETVWNDALTGGGAGATGGGVSDVFGMPPWQAAAGVPAEEAPKAHAESGPFAVSTSGAASRSESRRRGVPDVAGDADPDTGYQVLVDGQSQVFGGTSAVAPLWAGLIARLNQAKGTRFGLVQPALYAGIAPGAEVPGFNDITRGSNGAFSAGPGWDACTGLGSPEGTGLNSRLTAGVVT